MFFVDNDYENKTVNKNTYQIKQENNVFKFNKSTAIHQKHSVRLVNLIVDPYHSHAQENVQGTLWDAWKMVLKLGLTFLLGPNDWRSQIAWGKNGKKNKVKLFWMFDSGFYGHYNILIYIYIVCSTFLDMPCMYCLKSWPIGSFPNWFSPRLKGLASWNSMRIFCVRRRNHEWCHVCRLYPTPHPKN